MEKGIITKGIGGFYYVKCGDEIYECKARGRLRNEGLIPLVGDYVFVTLDRNVKKGIIEEIVARKVELIRPPVANVEQAIVVFSIKSPDLNLQFMDKLLILGEYSGLKLNIVINKIDLDNENQHKGIVNIYKNIGYNVIPCSTKSKVGIDKICSVLKDKITVFAGPSGVGKSSILNLIQPGLQLKTGNISKKIRRGKHTTRHSELLKLDFGGWVVDTPGFTALNIDFIEVEELGYLFPEFRNYIGKCKFTNCIHINEPDCEVKRALENGNINKNRYCNYEHFIKQIMDKKNRRY